MNKEVLPILELLNFSLIFEDNFGKKKIYGLKNINLKIYPLKITALIGKSGSGKSTLLWAINRLNEQLQNNYTEGKILLDNESIHSPKILIEDLRHRIGLIFQKPTPFLMSIFENVAFAYRLHSKKSEKEIYEDVKKALREVGLWSEVSNRLDAPASNLSGGQQQRLCIARCLINRPEIILMDEPTSALDPVAKKGVETLLFNLKKKYTIIFVTHSLSQASKISDYVAFLEKGKLIEFSKTQHLFLQPKSEKLRAFIREEE